MIREFREYVDKIIAKREKLFEQAKDVIVVRNNMKSEAREVDAFLKQFQWRICQVYRRCHKRS